MNLVTGGTTVSKHASLRCPIPAYRVTNRGVIECQSELRHKYADGPNASGTRVFAHISPEIGSNVLLAIPREQHQHSIPRRIRVQEAESRGQGGLQDNPARWAMERNPKMRVTKTQEKGIHMRRTVCKL
jgi:hypothetical protein